MNVPVLASRVARRYASLHGAASLRSAGLFDRDLVAKAMRVLLNDPNKDYLHRDLGWWEILTTKTYSVGYAYGVANKYYGKHNDYPANWDYDDVESEENVDLVSTFDDEWVYSLPMSIMGQIPPAQHMEFMHEVLQAVLHKEGAFTNAKALLEEYYVEESPMHDISEGDFDFTRLEVKSAKMKPPVFLSKRVQYKGKVATVRLKVVFTDIVLDVDPSSSEYEWTGSPPSGPDGGDWD